MPLDSDHTLKVVRVPDIDQERRRSESRRESLKRQLEAAAKHGRGFRRRVSNIITNRIQWENYYLLTDITSDAELDLILQSDTGRLKTSPLESKRGQMHGKPKRAKGLKGKGRPRLSN